MTKSIKFKNDTYIDSKGISHNKDNLYEYLENHFDGFQDTVGADIKEMLRNKMDYAVSLCTKQREIICLSGGWKGNNFGFSIFSNDTAKHLVWVSTYGIYLCRKFGNTYQYYKIPLTSF